MPYEEFNYKNKYTVIKIFYKKTSVPLTIDYALKFVVGKYNKITCDKNCNVYCFDAKNKKMPFVSVLYHYSQCLVGNCCFDNNYNCIANHTNDCCIDSDLGINASQQLFFLNKINFDLRMENITLIKPLELIKYQKAYVTQGDCYIFRHGDHKWKTSTSRKLDKTEKYKAVYDYMIEYILNNNDQFVDTQYDITIIALKYHLLKTFYKLAKLSNFSNLHKLKLNKIGELDLFTKQKQKSKIKKLPKYCYYSKPTETRGSFYYIENHPNLKEKKVWKTTTSKKIKDKQKYDQLVNKLKSIV